MDHVLTGIDLVMFNSSIGLSMMDTLNPVSAINYFLFGEGKILFNQKVNYYDLLYNYLHTCIYT